MSFFTCHNYLIVKILLGLVSGKVRGCIKEQPLFDSELLYQSVAGSN
jgi:hypothetical protein